MKSPVSFSGIAPSIESCPSGALIKEESLAARSSDMVYSASVSTETLNLTLASWTRNTLGLAYIPATWSAAKGTPNESARISIALLALAGFSSKLVPPAAAEVGVSMPDARPVDGMDASKVMTKTNNRINLFNFDGISSSIFYSILWCLRNLAFQQTPQGHNYGKGIVIPQCPLPLRVYLL